MCGLCSDYVDSCEICKELRQSKRNVNFYILDNFCDHLAEKWGTRSASMYYHVQYDHGWEFKDGSAYTCEDECLENEWWTYEELDRVIQSIRKEYED